MPISFHPDTVVDVWFDEDKDIPLEKRPIFKCKAMTCLQVETWFDSLNELIKKNTSHRDGAEMLLTYIIGWENYPEPLSADALLRVLTPREIWMLIRSLPTRIGANEADAKKSGLPSPTAGAASAVDAVQPAKTSPANANHS